MTEWGEYDAFLRDADADNRVGDQDFLITSIDESTWPSGDKFIKVKGQLVTAGGAKADFNLNPLPTKDELAQASTWETGKKRGVAQGIGFHKSLEKFYQKSAETLEVGDELRVKCVKNKEGFIRIAAILDPNIKAAPGAASGAGVKKSEIPF